MAENNTFNFDLDAPATPTLTLDPVEEAAPAEEKKSEPAPAPEEVKLTAEEKAMVDAFFGATFQGGRHAERVQIIKDMEAELYKPEAL